MFTPLSYESTIPRHLVHRQSVSEVLLTDQRMVNGVQHTGVQFPRGHRMWDPSGREHDPLLVAESLRQSVIVLCHNHFRVPLSYQFLMEAFGFEVLDALPVDSAADSWSLRTIPESVAFRDDVVSRLETTAELVMDGRVVAIGSAVARCMPLTSYSTLRGNRNNAHAVPRGALSFAQVVDPREVGRRDQASVVVARRNHDGGLFCVPDASNAALFDHLVDHVPGMALFETARQAVRLEIGDPRANVATLWATFFAFTEWDQRTRVTVVPDAALGGRSAPNYTIEFSDDSTGMKTASVTVGLVDECRGSPGDSTAPEPFSAKGPVRFVSPTPTSSVARRPVSTVDQADREGPNRVTASPTSHADGRTNPSSCSSPRRASAPR